MPDRNIRQLQVRPSQSADLAFNMPGIIHEQNFNHATGVGPCRLGGTVGVFDIKIQLYDHLGETLPASPSPPREADARLKFDGAGIRTVLSGGYLFALRNESIAAELEKLICQRENAFLDRYKHAPQLKAAMSTVYPSILTRMGNLSSFASARFTALDTAYGAGGVSTESISEGSSSQATNSTTVAMRNAPATEEAEFNANWIASKGYDPQQADAAKKHVQTQETQQSQSEPYIRVPDPSNPGSFIWKLPNEMFKSHASTTDSTTTNRLTSFQHPKLENKIEHEQLQIGLLLETLQQEFARHRVPFLDTILKNELAAIDAEVRKIQLNFAHTFLISPMPGIITAIYKDVGESVEPGEPVLRVENDEHVLIVGRVVHRALLTVGKDVNIHTTDLYEDGVARTFPGKIVAVRGHAADNDEWELVIECVNPLQAGRRVLPINYQFDRENSHVEFV